MANSSLLCRKWKQNLILVPQQNVPHQTNRNHSPNTALRHTVPSMDLPLAHRSEAATQQQRQIFRVPVASNLSKGLDPAIYLRFGRSLIWGWGRIKGHALHLNTTSIASTALSWDGPPRTQPRHGWAIIPCILCITMQYMDL